MRPTFFGVEKAFEITSVHVYHVYNDSVSISVSQKPHHGRSCRPKRAYFSQTFYFPADNNRTPPDRTAAWHYIIIGTTYYIYSLRFRILRRRACPVSRDTRGRVALLKLLILYTRSCECVACAQLKHYNILYDLPI